MELAMLIINVLTCAFALISGLTALLIWIVHIYKNKNKASIDEIQAQIDKYENLKASTGDSVAVMLIEDKINELKKSFPKTK